MNSKNGFSIHRIFSSVIDSFKKDQQQKLQKVRDLLNNIESEWNKKIEELEIQKNALEEKFYELKAEYEDEKKRLNDIESKLKVRIEDCNMVEIKYEEIVHENKQIKNKLCKIEYEKAKLEEQKKTAEAKAQEQIVAFEKEMKYLKDKLTSIEGEWKTRLEKQEKAYVLREESMKHSHAEQIKQMNEKHQREVETLICELKSRVSYLDKKLYEEQKKKEEYRQYAEFVIEPRHQILDYARKAVELIQLVKDACLKASDFERKNLYADENVSYFYQKSINKFIKTTSSKTIEGWISELPQFARTGMYSTDKKSLLHSIFINMKSAADQLSSLKFMLHHDLMTDYGSAALILLQELSSLEQLSGTHVDSSAIMYFKETLKTVMKKLVDLEYQIVYVELFTKFRASDEFKLVGSVNVDFFEHDVVLEIQKMGIRYGGTKNKTEVIINR